jgi:hypothetical protein
VDDVRRDLDALSSSEAVEPLGRGDAAPELLAGLRIEYTAFDRALGVEQTPGWISNEGRLGDGRIHRPRRKEE